MASSRITLNVPSDGYVLYRLSEQNKQRLLGNAIGDREKNEAEGRGLIERLSWLDASIAREFGLRSAAVLKAPLKLLFSKDAYIVRDSSSQIESFIIISYCWHDEMSDWKKAASDPDYAPWPFPRELVEGKNGILAMRSSPDEGVWLDAVCIDQRPTAEKIAAVAAMNLLYASARQLIIILEDILVSEEEEEFALAWFEYIKRKDNPYPGSPGWDRPAFLAGLAPGADRHARSLYSKIMSSRWFTRAWCHHEIRCSLTTHDWTSQPRIRAMGESGRVVPILWQAFTTLIQFYEDPLTAPLMDRMTAAQRPSPFQIQVARFLGREEWLPKITAPHSLFAQLYGVLAMGATYTNDKVQIVINLHGLPLAWQPQPDSGKQLSSDEIYWIFILLALAAGDVNVLGFTGTPLILPVESNRLGSDGSWARRPSDINVECGPSLTPNLDLGLSIITPQYVTIDLLFLEKPVRLSQQSIDIAGQTLSTYDLYDRMPVMSSPARQARMARTFAKLIPTQLSEERAAARRQSLRTLLACCIEGGIEWMVSAWTILQRLLTPEEEKPDSYETPEGPFWDGFLGTFAENPGSSLHQAALYLLQEIGCHDEGRYLKATICLLALISDIRSQQPGVFSTQPPTLLQTRRAWPQESSADYAILPATVDDVVGQVVAVPLCLACDHHNIARGWVLEPYGGGELDAWRLVSKHRLQGSQDLAADGHVVVLRRRQRVYGTRV